MSIQYHTLFCIYKEFEGAIFRFTRIFHNTDDKILCSKLLSEDFNGAISDRFDMAFSDFYDFYFVTQAV